MSVFAANTADKIVLSETLLDPGSDAKEVTVSLNGVDNHTYCGFNMDIIIPEWMDVVKSLNDDDEEVVCIKASGNILKSGHQLSSNVLYIEGKKTIRVSCLSLENAAFKATSGNLFSFKLKASMMAKPGEASLNIINTDFAVYNSATASNTYYHFTDATSKVVSVSTNATATVSVSADTKWSTCILPFSMDMPEGLKAYSCQARDEENSVLKLTEVSAMQAFTPYILYSEEGYSETITDQVDEASYPASDVVENGFLAGAVTSQKITSGYVLQNLSSGVKFYSCGGDEFIIPAGKCWVKGDGSKAKSFQMVDDVANAIKAAQLNTDEDRYFTISGTATDGGEKNRIYIRNGKKTIKK